MDLLGRKKQSKIYGLQLLVEAKRIEAARYWKRLAKATEALAMVDHIAGHQLHPQEDRNLPDQLALEEIQRWADKGLSE